MVTASADDSAHGKPVFDRKVTEDTTPKDHRSDEEIAATIKEDQFALGSGTNVLPMTVGIARGWAPGVIALLLGFGVTFWTSRIIASFHEYGGRRNIRYRDLASSVLGEQTAVYTLLGGTKHITLTEFIAIMGVICMLFTQLPTFHSLWFINLLNMLNTYLFTAVALIIAIFQSAKYDLPRDYGVHGSNADKAFGVFQGIVIMHFVYGNTIIPEIQATAKAPSVVTMNKAIYLLYAQLAVTYIPAAFIGYACFGSALVSGGGSFLPFYMASIPSADNPSPKWALVLINLLILWNAVCGCMIYSAPIMETFETKLLDQKGGLWAVKNWFTRTALRCFYIFLAAFFAAMFPYFGDILALVGALGITPIDFVLPLAMYIFLRKPKGWKLWLNWTLMVFYICIMIIGAVAAIRGIVLDASIAMQ
ncbi:TPA: hypothetical protein ACH3X2_006664 [Trebouxia sp. C0005]